MEKREKYVEGRIAEKFERPDIINYLSVRRCDDRWCKTWEKLAPLLFPYDRNDNLSYGDIIARFKNPLKDRLGTSGSAMSSFVSYWLLQRPDEIEVYSLDLKRFIVKYSESYQGRKFSGSHYCVLGGHSDLTAQDVVNCLAGNCWIDPADEACETKRKGCLVGKPRGAREFLSKLLETAVAREASEAKRDFDCACAVSPDGKKITRADRVVVVKKDGSTLAFDADLFLKNKIERPENMGRIKAYGTSDDRQAIEMVKSGKHDAVYAAAQNFKWNDDLIVAEKFVPHPLPDTSGKMVVDIV